MAKAKAAPAAEEVVIETAEAVVEAPKASKAKVTSVTVRWRGQERTFSQADHGDDFEALAKEFATKFDGTIVA